MGCTNSNSAQPPAASAKRPAEAPQGTSSSSSSRSFEVLYTLGDKLGEGTYSVVRVATRKSDGVKVAVKIVSRGGMSPEDQKGLLREVEIMRSFDHPNIVKLFDFFEEPEKYFVVLEYIPGGELFERLVEKTFYTENEAREIAVVLFKAIKYIHDRDIVHRDLKPENILLMSREDDVGIKIADFGFAARIGTGTLKQQAGTPGYVSPEVLERKPHGKPVDMWAMGVILYMLLGGYPPFYQNDEDQRAMYRRILTGNYQFHPEYWSNISAEAKDLITGLLTVDPNVRLTVDQVLAHAWLKKSKEELSLVSLDRTLAVLKDFRAQRAVKIGALAAGIAIDVARKFSGANLSRTNLLNDVAVDVIRKLSNSNINELASEARRRSQQSASMASNTAGGKPRATTPNASSRL